MKKNLFKLNLIFLIGILLGVVNLVKAATYTSTGSGNWNTNTTWSPSGVPGAKDVVTILAGHTITLTSDVGGGNGINSLTINSTGKLIGNWSVTIASILTVNGILDLRNTGNLTFRQNATLVVNGEIYVNSITHTGSTLTVTGDGVVVANTFDPLIPNSVRAKKVWVGINSGSWADNNNWFPVGVPAATDTISISSIAINILSVTDVKTIQSIKLPLGAVINIPATGTLTISGLLDHDGTINLKSTSATVTGSMIVGSVSTSGTSVANIERYMTGACWHLVAAPVTGQSINNFVTNPANSIFVNSGYTPNKYGLGPYDNSITNWVPYTTSSISGAANFIDAKGYEIYRSSDGVVTYTGNLKTTTSSIGVTVGGNAWNLVGNPYTSAIQGANIGTTDFLTVNNSAFDPAAKALYVWDASTGSYTIINNLSGATYIASGQAFFMKSVAGGSTATFNPNMRAHNAVAFKNAAQTWPNITLLANIGGKDRITEVHFVENGTPGLDPGYDAVMFDGNGTANTVYTQIDGFETGFGIQCLPDNLDKDVIIPVGLNAKAGTKITFTAEALNIPSGVKVYLKDVANNTYTRLDVRGSSYEVVLASETTGIGRFYLLTSKQTLGTPESKDDLYSIFTVPSESKIRIIGNFAKGTQVAVYSLDGKVLYSGRINNIAENEIRFAPAVSGIYLVRIQSGTSVINRKISWMY